MSHGRHPRDQPRESSIGLLRSAGRADRAQSEVLGIALLLSMTIVGVTVTLGMGVSGFEAARDDARTTNTRQAMTQFDSRASLVALGDASSQTTTIDVSGESTSLYVDEDAGWMNVTIVNDSTGEVESVIMNVTLGALVYENGGTIVAYQGGGVWRYRGNASVMISPPEYHFRSTADEPTLTLPVVAVRGHASDSTVSISENGSALAKYPVEGDANLSNPLEDGRVNVTVHSKYYEAWGRFFADRTDGNVTYNHDRDTATSVLVAEEEQFTVRGGLFISNGGEDYNHIHAKEGKSGIDEYNSSVGPYPGSRTGYGKLIAEAGVEIQEGRFNTSRLVSGSGEVRLEEDGFISGDLSYGGWINDEGGDDDPDEHVGGWIKKNASVTEAEGIGSLTADKRSEIKSNNNNSAEGDIVLDGDKWEFNSSQNNWDLGAGDYYINGSNIDWNDGNEKLTLNLENGDIELVLDIDHLKLEDGATIKVKKPSGGTANIYLADDGDTKVEIKKNAKVTVKKDKSESLWFYGRKDSKTEFKLEDGATFTGVFYAPGTDDKETKGDIKKDAEVYGAVVADEIKVEDNATIHYDKALKDADPIPTSEEHAKITYLHVSVNYVNVSS